MVTSFVDSFEQGVDPVAGLVQPLAPALERAAAVVGDLVRTLRRPRQVVAPLRRDEPALLERTQSAVDVADVDAVGAEQAGSSAISS